LRRPQSRIRDTAQISRGKIDRLRLDRGLSPPSCRSCSAHKKKPARRGPAGAVRRIAFRQVSDSDPRIKRLDQANGHSTRFISRDSRGGNLSQLVSIREPLAFTGEFPKRDEPAALSAVAAMLWEDTRSPLERSIFCHCHRVQAFHTPHICPRTVGHRRRKAGGVQYSNQCASFRKYSPSFQAYSNTR
jgi:hypothetical protein